MTPKSQTGKEKKKLDVTKLRNFCAVKYTIKKMKRQPMEQEKYFVDHVIDKGQPKCPPIGEWINKTWHIYILGYYLSIKRNEVRIHTITWTNLQTC